MRWRTATEADAREVLTFLRASDREEIAFTRRALGMEAARGFTEQTLELLETHRCETLHDELGDPIALAGCGEIEPGVGVIWLLATPTFDRKWRPATRAVRSFVERVSRPYRTVGNVVPQHMKKRVRWLRHLGFDFASPEANPIGRGLLPFWRETSPRPEGGPAAS